MVEEVSESFPVRAFWYHFCNNVEVNSTLCFAVTVGVEGEVDGYFNFVGDNFADMRYSKSCYTFCAFFIEHFTSVVCEVVD